MYQRLQTLGKHTEYCQSILQPSTILLRIWAVCEEKHAVISVVEFFLSESVKEVTLFWLGGKSFFQLGIELCITSPALSVFALFLSREQKLKPSLTLTSCLVIKYVSKEKCSKSHVFTKTLKAEKSDQKV